MHLFCFFVCLFCINTAMIPQVTKKCSILTGWNTVSCGCVCTTSSWAVVTLHSLTVNGRCVYVWCFKQKIISCILISAAPDILSQCLVSWRFCIFIFHPLFYPKDTWIIFAIEVGLWREKVKMKSLSVCSPLQLILGIKWLHVQMLYIVRPSRKPTIISLYLIMRCFSCGLEIFRLHSCWNWIHSHLFVKPVVSNSHTQRNACG